MAKPQDVLAQLLSESQAGVLARLGDSSWQAITRVLGAVMDAAPMLDSAEGSLVMPDEISGDYAGRHIAVPVRLTTAQDQQSLAFVTFATDALAAFFDIATNDKEDEERQLQVIGSTIAGQLVQGLNSNVFAGSAEGLALETGDLVANTMAPTLDDMDEPALYLQLRFAGSTNLECAVVLPGTFLDIMANTAPAAGSASPAAPAGSMPFMLTAEEIDDAEIVDLPLTQEYAQPRQQAPDRNAELVGAGVVSGIAGMTGARNQAGDEQAYERDPALMRDQAFSGGNQLPPRPPTPITEAPTAQRARFAPLPENEPPAFRGNMDLLSSLQMNVTVELGRTHLTVAEVLALGSGSVVELDRLAGEPVDILVNDRIIARGEVVVVDENFGVRVVEVIRRGSENEERAS